MIVSRLSVNWAFQDNTTKDLRTGIFKIIEERKKALWIFNLKSLADRLI
jgi:hypothetical protein